MIRASSSLAVASGALGKVGRGRCTMCQVLLSAEQGAMGTLRRVSQLRPVGVREGSPE